VLPRWQRPAHAVAQHAGIAGEEVDLVPGLERNAVERIIDGDVFEDAASLVPASTGERAKSGDVSLSPRRGEPGRSLMALPCDGKRLAIGRQAVEITFEDMRHDEAGIGRDGGITIEPTGSPMALQLAHRAQVVIEAGRAGAGEREAERIGKGHMVRLAMPTELSNWMRW
jgi:hypothetical protein